MRQNLVFGIALSIGLLIGCVYSQAKKGNTTPKAGVDGVITDTRCWCSTDPHHDKACIRNCVENKHAKYAICSNSSPTTAHRYVLDDAHKDMAEKYAGQRVHLEGTFDEVSQTVQVASIEALDSPIDQQGTHKVFAQNDLGRNGEWSGWVSDSKCGAKGANSEHAQCAKKCIAAGEKPVLVTDRDQKVVSIMNPDSVSRREGQHIQVKGTVTTDGSLYVKSVAMLGQH